MSLISLKHFLITILFSLVSTAVFCQSQIGCTFSRAGGPVSISADRSIIAIGAGGGVQVFENVGDSWSQVGSDIIMSDPSSKSLSADGRRLAICGRYAYDSSYVRVFENIGGNWAQIGTDIIGKGNDDDFGRSVSLSADGSRVAIGSPYEYWTPGNDTGYVRIFEYTNGDWAQIGMDIEGKIEHDLFGSCVSLSSNGKRLAVGAPANNGSFSGNRRYAGQVRVFEYASGSWTQIGSDINGESWDDNSGTSVSLSSDGSRLAIGAPDAENDTGHVRIFEYIGGSWAQIGTDIIGEDEGDGFGTSVSLSADGSVVAIGGPSYDAYGESYSGHVRMLKYINGDWKQINKDIAGTHSATYAGQTLSLSADGGIVVIGTGPAANGNGSVRVFSNYMKPQWSQIGTDIDGESTEDESGASVSLSADGSRVAIGAPDNSGNGDDAGHVRIFENTGGNWSQIGGDIDGEDWEDQSGRAISLSADGSRVAIGAPGNSGNGYQAGHVRVFEYNGGNWTQMGNDIDGEAAGDLFGSCLSLSANGSRIAIGAPEHRVNGFIAGQVQTLQYNNGTWTKLGGVIDGEYGWYHIGRTVALSANGNRLAIGVAAWDSAFVQIFEYTNGSWTQIGHIPMSGGSISLSEDGSKVAIGDEWDGDCSRRLSGLVRVFEYKAGSWTQIGEDINGEAFGDYSGTSVSISANGNRLAVGAPNNGTDYIGMSMGVIGGGHVRIFEFLNGSWIQVKEDIDGEDWGDYSGSSVSLSADGSVVAIGAPGNSGNGDDAGHVRVYGDIKSPSTTFLGRVDNHVKLFPNPTTGTINVSLPEPQGYISIMSIMGDILKNIPVTQKEMQIDLDSYARGMYLILVKQNGLNTAHRIILIN
jgi:hypothetical protein